MICKGWRTRKWPKISFFPTMNVTCVTFKATIVISTMLNEDQADFNSFLISERLVLMFVSSLKHCENNILHADIILPVLPQPSWNVEQYRLKLSTLVQKELKLKITLSSFKKCLNCQSKYLNRYERKTIGFVWYCPRFRDS